MVLVGNKSDLEVRRKVSLKEADGAASEHGISYFESSAMENVGVDEPFYFLASIVHENYIESTKEFTEKADGVA